MPRDYDSTAVRVAGNLLSGHPSVGQLGKMERKKLAKAAIKLAHHIIKAERRWVKRQEEKAATAASLPAEPSS